MAVFHDLSTLPQFQHASLTIGTFDGVHLGHRAILDQVRTAAQSAGGESIVITFHPHPRSVLYPLEQIQILTPLRDKLELLAGAGIDHTIVVPFTPEFAALSAQEYVSKFLVGRFNPHTIVIGYDHHFGRDRSGNIGLLRAQAADFGYEVSEIPAQTVEEAAVSSTKIRNAVRDGQVGLATAMLGRNYSVEGTVARGKQLGRTIGFPTANLLPAAGEQLLPAQGVYAARVVVEGKQYGAMLNIGQRPTVEAAGEKKLEAHLFNFEGDLYDKELEVQFVAWLREEQKFSSLDALKDQLSADRTEAQKALGD
jgi:riboflavin kinase/FMN adenylyltransferase